MDSRENDTAGFQPSEPTLCANGCGFFGNPSTNGMCSKCYREVLFHQENTVSAKSALEKIAPRQSSDDGDVAEKSQISAEAATDAVKEDESRSAAAPMVRNRCFSCKKKVGLLGFECRCGGTFCGAHRYAEQHRCAFDFKGVGRDEIEKANPLVKADKIDNKI